MAEEVAPSLFASCVKCASSCCGINIFSLHKASTQFLAPSIFPPWQLIIRHISGWQPLPKRNLASAPSVAASFKASFKVFSSLAIFQCSPASSQVMSESLYSSRKTAKSSSVKTWQAIIFFIRGHLFSFKKQSIFLTGDKRIPSHFFVDRTSPFIRQIR